MFDETKISFEFNSKSFCSEECKDNFLKYSIPYKNKESNYTNPDDYVECKICGFRSPQISRHIIAYHFPVDKYCNLYNLTKSDLVSKNENKRISERNYKLMKEGKLKGFTSENNPSKSDSFKNGEYSPYSKNFKKYEGLNDEEKDKIISDLFSKREETRSKNNNNNTTIDYYLNKGYTLRESYFLLKERQRTFTLEKCIKKYGQEEGTRIYKERQEKWMNTLNSKSPEEIERILRAKFSTGGYSKISQELFDSIMKRIGEEKFNEVYYATRNKEYIVERRNGKHFLLDFYVKDVNKIIEFDGSFWHKDTKDKDIERDSELLELGYSNILRIDEDMYRFDQEGTVDECVKFLLDN